jgi:hypothetical protein
VCVGESGAGPAGGRRGSRGNGDEMKCDGTYVTCETDCDEEHRLLLFLLF